MNSPRIKLEKEKIFNILKFWVPLTLILTLLTGLMYLLVQQNIRLNANFPQIQIAEDVAGQLKNNGISPDLSALKTVEISQSLSPYAMFYSESGEVIKSSGLLDGVIPRIPGGILDYTRVNGIDRVTWQPRKGVRQALVAVHFSGRQSGFVVSGRSLRESENIIDSITLITFAGWITVVVTGLILIAAFQFLF
jgi:hypothetical protein